MALKETAIFKSMPQPDHAASRAAGRPIYRDVEVCELHFPGDKQHKPVFPAHSFAGWAVDEYGNQERQTYAIKYNEQYLRFRQGRVQIADGTPLSELPFLTEARRMELKALKIYSAEQLASLDGNNLKNLGQGGRALKEQAEAYLDAARTSAGSVALAEENAALRERIAELSALAATEPQADETVAPDAHTAPDDNFLSFSDDQLKAFIREKSGRKVRGEPERKILLAMARQLDQAGQQT